MQWQITPYIIPSLIAAVISLTVAFLAWQRRTTPGAITLSLLMLATAEWALGNVMEFSVTTEAEKIFWAKIQYIGIVTVPVLWFAFAMQFTHRDRWFTRRNVGLLFIVPLITLFFVWTNETHGLVWAETGLNTAGPIDTLAITHGTWFWIWTGYAYVLLLTGTFWIIQMLLRTTHLFRWQAALLLLGVLAPWIGNIIFLVAPVQVDPTPIAFSITGIALGWGLFRWQLLGVTPVMRRTIIEMMSDAVIVIDMQQRIADMNPAAQQLTGQTLARAVGKPCTPILSGIIDIDYTQDGHTETAISQTDGSQRYFDIRVSTLSNQKDRPMGRLIVLRDITPRRQAEIALAQAHDDALEASRLKSRLLANVSHDLRTPLNAILGYTEMLQEEIYGPLTDRQRNATSEIIDSSGQLLSFINNLLGQAQIEAGKLKLNLNPFFPTKLIDDVKAMLDVVARSKGLELTSDISPDVPATLPGDLYWLRQILANLINNAIKFTDEGSIHVHIFLPDNDHWAMQVSDTGRGIPLEAQSYIFDAFQQVDGTDTKQHAGSGLGLSIVKELTDLMDGEIALNSMINSGSTFTVSFPLITTQE